MSNGDIERMVVNVKISISRIMSRNNIAREEAVRKVLYGYRHRKGTNRRSLFEVTYVKAPRLVQEDFECTNMDLKERKMKLLASKIRRCNWARKINQNKGLPELPRKFAVGSKVWVIQCKALQQTVKWTAFHAKYYNSCVIQCTHIKSSAQVLEIGWGELVIHEASFRTTIELNIFV